MKGFIKHEEILESDRKIFQSITSGDEVDIIDYACFCTKEYYQENYEDAWIEENLPIRFINSFSKGRADLIFFKHGKLKVIDYKSGSKFVDANDNFQLFVYAFSTILNKDLIDKIETVELQIVQPSINNYSRTTIGIDELVSWGKDVLIPSGRKSTNPSINDIKYGVWCSECPSKLVCRAYEWYKTKKIRISENKKEVVI